MPRARSFCLLLVSGFRPSHGQTGSYATEQTFNDAGPKSAYRKSPSQAVTRDRKQIVNAKSNAVLQGLAVLSLLRNSSGGCKRKAHRECSSRDCCNQPSLTKF